MEKYDILTVVGARPQFIKAAALSRSLMQSDISEGIIHTGQHFDSNMSENFFKALTIPEPIHNLNINSLSHSLITARMLEGLEPLFIKYRPKMILVYGDTNSTLAASLCAAKLHIPIAHVEAGLRSFNLKMPEEINRILTDRLSEILFCPSEIARQNLINEGVSLEKIFIVGDVMFDAVRMFFEPSNETTNDQMEFGYKSYHYLTIHREENLQEVSKIKDFLLGLDISEIGNQVVFSIHPRTSKIIKNLGIEIKHIKIISPQAYKENLKLIKNAKSLITDSGGMQKEAYFLNTPCITLRNETEWLETVEVGANRLCGLNLEKLLSLITLDWYSASNRKIYGEGNSCQLIANIIKSKL